MDSVEYDIDALCSILRCACHHCRVDMIVVKESCADYFAVRP
jgi:hypothetical protein